MAVADQDDVIITERLVGSRLIGLDQARGLEGIRDRALGVVTCFVVQGWWLQMDNG